jgi:hypothetical protein
MSARRARRRPALTAAPFAVGEPDLQDARAELDRATSALWLLDQIHNGELCFLTLRTPRLPCWVSAPAAEAIRPEEVADWLQDMALKTMADALAAVRTASRIGTPRSRRREAPG